LQPLESDPQLLQVVGADLGEGLPVPGDPGQQLTADRPGRADRLVDLAQQAPGPVEQGLAGQGELDAVRGTAQQITADQPFQAADLAAQRGLRKIKAGGGPAEVQFVGHRDERAEMTQLYGVGRLRQRHDLGVLVVHGSIIARRTGPWSCRLCTAVMHTRPFPSRWYRCQRRGMPPNRIADLRLRGNTSPLPVRVYWPGQAASRPVPLLVFCMAGAGAEESCRSLSEDLGLLILAVSCPAGAQDGMTALEWAAEHAAELGADPGRLLVAGQGAGSAVAAAVASRARAAGWPAVMLAAGRSDADLSEAVRRSLAGQR
jgi:hypothetical protein